MKNAKKENKLPGLIILICALAFFIGSVIFCIRDKNIYIEDFACVFGLAILGIILLKKQMKSYGIGIGAVVGFTVIVDTLIDGDWVMAGTFTVLTGTLIVALAYINSKTNKAQKKNTTTKKSGF